MGPRNPEMGPIIRAQWPIWGPYRQARIALARAVQRQPEVGVGRRKARRWRSPCCTLVIGLIVLLLS